MSVLAALIAALDELARLLAPRLARLDVPRDGADDALRTVTSEAARVGVHPETLRRAIRAGKLRVAGWVGRRNPRLAKADVDEWLAAGGCGRGGGVPDAPRPRTANGQRSRPMAAAMAAAGRKPTR